MKKKNELINYIYVSKCSIWKRIANDNDNSNWMLLKWMNSIFDIGAEDETKKKIRRIPYGSSTFYTYSRLLPTIKKIPCHSMSNAMRLQNIYIKSKQFRYEK